MTLSGEASIERARHLLLEAMFDESRWGVALEAVAGSCGARAGQLIALNGAGAVSAHWLTGTPDGFAAEIEAFGLSNPVVNPRVRIGADAPLLRPVADQDFVDEAERKRSPIYAEMFEPHDLLFNCQVVLMRGRDTLVRASVTRTRKQGALDSRAFSAFQNLIPNLHAAVRVQANLLASKCAATLETLDAVAAAAFLLSESGAVIGLSAAAEQMVIDGAHLQVANARLRLRSPTDQATLDALVMKTLAAQRDGVCQAPHPLPLSRSALALDIQPLPRERMCFSGSPALILIVRPVQPRERGGALERVYRLTSTEAQVALALAAGDGIEAIATRRKVTLATVRSQLQSIYSKMDVHRQAELVAVIRGLGEL